MNTEKTIKSAAAEAAGKIHNGVDVAEDAVDASVDGASARLAALEAQLRDTGERLLASAKEISAAAGSQVRTHPLAAFGICIRCGYRRRSHIAPLRPLSRGEPHASRRPRDMFSAE